MSSSRHRFSREHKAQVVRRHLANKESISSLAEEFGLQPSQIHLWVNTLLAQGEQACERSSGSTRADKAEARRKITACVERYKTVRLNSAIGDITPADKLLGLEQGSFRNVTANWRRPACDANRPANTVLARQRLPDDCSQVTISHGLVGGYGSAEVDPDRRPKGQDRSPGGLTTARLPRLRDWHQGVTPSWHDAATS